MFLEHQQKEYSVHLQDVWGQFTNTCLLAKSHYTINIPESLRNMNANRNMRKKQAVLITEISV